VGEMSLMSDQPLLIRIEALSKRFDGRNPVLALDDLNLEVRRGEFLSIVGPSGCGKTTLLRIIAGLEPMTSGTIEFSGHGALDIGFVFQEPNLMPWRTALRNAELVLELHGCEEGERRARAQHVLELSGLGGFEGFLPKDLSGGMKQRVAIARALAHDPAVLVMDEPFAALDVLTRSEMSLELRRIWQKTRKTIIYVTHDLREAVLLSERVVVLTSQPGTVKACIDISLPDPRTERTKDSLEFVGFQGQIRELIGHRRAPRKAAAPIGAAIPAGSGLREGSWKRHVSRYVKLIAVFVALVGLWKGAVLVLDIPAYLLPPPEAVFVEYLEHAVEGLFWWHTAVTLSEAVLGFAAGCVLGFLIGYVLAKSEGLSEALMPYVVAAQTVPKIAFAPLMVIWFGFGITSKLLLTMLIVFFPVLVNTILGIRSIQRNPRELMQAAGSSRWQTFIVLELPSISPMVLAACKTSITLAVIGAVVGEFVGARVGLGFLTLFSAGRLDTTTTFVALLQLVFLGIALYSVVDQIERRALRWRDEK